MVAEVEETTLKLIAEMMRSFSQILKAATEIEEAGGQPFEVLKKLFSPEKLAQMRNTLPPDLYAAPLFKLASEAPTYKHPPKTQMKIAEITAKTAASKLTIQLPPPTAPPAPQLHAAVATAPNAAATPTAVKALIGAQVRTEEDPDWGPT